MSDSDDEIVMLAAATILIAGNIVNERRRRRRRLARTRSRMLQRSVLTMSCLCFSIIFVYIMLKNGRDTSIVVDKVVGD